MSLNRNVFLDTLIKESVKLNTLFLNHSGAPVKLHTDMPSIDLLADKEATRRFIDYCVSHPLAQEVILKQRFKMTLVLVTYHDGSQMNFKLISRMIRKSLDCLPVKEIMKEASVNDFGMLVPSPHHHFEYILLNYQFAESSFPDKYQKYFSALDPAERKIIFRYIQPKYNLVFNMLEDLYQYKGGVLLKIIIAIRRLKSNTFLKMVFRFLLRIIWSFRHMFSGKAIHLAAKNTVRSDSKNFRQESVG